MSNKYLQEAAKLSAVAVELSDAQMKIIAGLKKTINERTEQLGLALEIIDEKVKSKELTDREARLAKLECQLDIENSIEEINLKIREIDPSWTSSAKEVVEATMQKLAYGSVVFAGKAGKATAQVGRPIFNAVRELVKEFADGVREGYQTPTTTASKLEFLRAASKSRNA